MHHIPETASIPKDTEVKGKQPKTGESKESLYQEMLMQAKKGWESLKKLFGATADKKEAKAGLVAAAMYFIGILSGKRPKAKSDKKRAEKEGQTEKPKQDVKKVEAHKQESGFEEVKPQPATKVAGLPEDLEGTKYSEANILKCNIEQCRKLMKLNGFVLDEGSGNYINPRYITPRKILSEPLVKSTVGKKEVTLKRSVMRRLKAADAAMFAETGEHIKIREHFRANAYQLKLFHRMRPKKWRVASPGHSFHEIGQAIDVANWEKASKYLWEQGFIGGKQPIGLKGDANHFSINEIGLTDTRIAALKKEGIDREKKAA